MSCFLAAGLLLSSAYGQPGTGTVKGTLTDDSGAVIPAATVTLTSSNGTSRTAQSQAEGSYTFNGVAPGQYTVQVNFPGFTPFSHPITVNSGATVQVPIQLALSTEKQQITVSAESGPTVNVEPENNATALVIKGEDLQSLPDDPDDLADALQALAGPGAGPNGGQIYIDGFSGGQLPPKESIREVRINQNPFSAEYDRLGFGRIEILTKPGSDRLRGMFFLNDSDAVFDSRNPFASNKPDYSNRMYGGNIGGPLGKHASYFLDYNERDITNNAITNAVYLDPTTLASFPINNAVVTPQMNRTITPRLDYQLSTNNTLTVRFEERMSYLDNDGLGGYHLPAPYSELAYNNSGDAQNLMVTETAVLNAATVNETRFQYYRNWSRSQGNELPEVNVANSFITGGNGIGNTFDRTHHFELQNYTSLAKSKHTLKFGVRVRRDSDQNNNPQGFNGAFTFLGGDEPVLNADNQIEYDANGNAVTELLTSLQQYQRNLTLQQAGFTAAEIQTLGGGPSRYTIQAGEPYISMTRYDAAPFVQDDWRMKSNLTVSLGLRYEVQNLDHDYNDWAPRVGFAWAPGKSKSGRQTTVIRGGSGIFYDRIGLSPYEQAALNNGHTQTSYTVYNPDFYLSDIPPVSTLSPGQNSIYVVDPKLRADYSIQSAIGVERQLPRSTTASLTYTNTHAEHYLQTVPTNAPLPGTFNPLLPLGPTNGVFPFGYSAGNIFEYESGGILRQNILMATLNTRFNKNVSIYANYQLTYANDLPSTPTNPYDFMQDYGRSTLDRRHNFQLFGSVQAPLGLRFAPFITLRSGMPYDVLVGEDLYGDTLENARAAFAPAGSCPAGFLGTIGDVVCSRAGAFTTNYNPASPANLVPRDYLTMTGLVSVNIRVYRVFGFGAVQGNGAMPSGGGGGGGHYGGGGGRGGGAMSMGPAGGGRGMFGGTTEHRFNLTIGLNVTNILNHFNPAGYQGVITSPQFLEATTVNTGFGGGGVGGGGAGAANNRRIEFDSRFTF
ncbi:MAG TPA: TonB-dependent receptor [Bryobacteraceae bacterium]|nr:TonB-dependent receptor [Bryobacteraceae bacterium]